MEPITYMVSAFYATVGTAFYLNSKTDFEFASAYEHYREKKLRKLIKRNRFDEKKIEFLEEYTKNLREQLAILKNE